MIFSNGSNFGQSANLDLARITEINPLNVSNFTIAGTEDLVTLDVKRSMSYSQQYPVNHCLINDE